MTETEAKRVAAERDSGWGPVPLCQKCGRLADDPAHILPKSRFPKQRADVKNIVWLCRDDHNATETLEGRLELLQIMHEKYGYRYDEPPYDRYWQQV